ncbi:MAG: protein-methionine-sulfoxide reductase catalytic subunit MsrP [Alphaproteobacteria bacterium]|nr:protein-methionine-sulfoxide reductase catalytic subunit MsrP [Alphaproteobacteria bacterium]
MQILRRRGWELPESEATPEAVFHDRRRLIQAAALGGIAAAAGPIVAHATTTETDPTANLYPGPRNPTYTLDRPLTPEEAATTYNNFYEFGSSKGIWKRARDNLRIRPWTVHLDGDVEKPIEIGFDDLVRKMGVEERLYRHRCVEAWAMAVPWSGFPMAKLVAFAKPLAKAKYVRMETFNDPDMASGQKEFWYPWPYVEGVTIEEATNDLAFIVTGLYGKPVPAQNGAPLRLALPWKYGFKSIKSIVRFTFTDDRPKSFWEKVQGREYGFWANVNPEVPHRRWSQATERMIGTDDRRKTLLYNGYGEFVAHLYEGMDQRKLFY